jgi:hypothetical protein
VPSPVSHGASWRSRRWQALRSCAGDVRERLHGGEVGRGCSPGWSRRRELAEIASTADGAGRSTRLEADLGGGRRPCSRRRRRRRQCAGGRRIGHNHRGPTFAQSASVWGFDPRLVQLRLQEVSVGCASTNAFAFAAARVGCRQATATPRCDACRVPRWARCGRTLKATLECGGVWVVRPSRRSRDSAFRVPVLRRGHHRRASVTAIIISAPVCLPEG